MCIRDSGVCILNADDECCRALIEVCNARVVTYGVQNDADYRADDIRLGTQHSRFKLLHQGREYEVKTNLIALYNIYNLLAAIEAMHESGLELEKVLDCLDTLDQVDGRLERIDEGQPFNVFVDFAHTPDGLQKVFEYAKLITQPQRKIWLLYTSRCV